MRKASCTRYVFWVLCSVYGLLGGTGVWAQQEYKHIALERDTARIYALIKASDKIKFELPDSAIALAKQALKISQAARNERGTVASLMAIGVYFFNGKGEIKRAKTYFFEALARAHHLPGNDALLPRLYNCLGNVYRAEGTADSASHFYFRALDILGKQKTKDTRALILNYTNLGANFSEMGNSGKALFYLGKSLELSVAQRDTEMMAQGYLYLGETFGNQHTAHSLDSAVKYWEAALPLFLAVKQPINAMQVCINLGHSSWLGQRDIKKAKRYYDSAITLNRAAALNSPDLLRGLGQLNYTAGDYKQAIFYMKQTLKVSEQNSLRSYKLYAYEYLADIYRKTGDYKQAFEYQRNYALLSDSLMNEKMINTISQLDVKYRAAEKDRELAKNKLALAMTQTRLSKSNSRTIGITLGALSLVIFTITIFLKQRLQLQKAKVAEQLQRVEQLKAVFDGEEKERSRIGRQLHDDIMVELSIVKMGLNALPIKFPYIKHTAPYTNLVQQLNHTSQKLRQSAHNLMPDALLTDGLVSAISYFCSNIIKMTGLKIHFQYYGEIPRLPADMEISIYRIIQELVQNVIKHAQATNTLVQLNYRENILSITVEDDGTGFDPKHKSLENKMGLKSIQTRLKALNGTLDIHECMPHGSSVNITLLI